MSDDKTVRAIRDALGVPDERFWNLKTLRLAEAVGFGWACYTLSWEGGKRPEKGEAKVHGKNVGLAKDYEMAKKWVDGDDTITPTLWKIERKFKKPGDGK